MGYRLGTDLGTTYTAAAVAVDGEVSMVTLGSVTPETPTVVAIDRDDQWLFGDRAVRLAAVHPERVAREFKRRVGDPVPVTVAGNASPVDDLLSATLRHVVDAAVEQMGELPESTTVTYPAGWGEFKKTQLEKVLEQAEIPVGRLVSEPVAAAARYLHTRMLEPARRSGPMRSWRRPVGQVTGQTSLSRSSARIRFRLAAWRPAISFGLATPHPS